MLDTERIRRPLSPNAEERLEIGLRDIWRFLKDSRWLLLRFAAIGLVVGALYAFTRPNQYTSQVTVMPEIQSKLPTGNLGGLGSLAGLAGLDLNSVGSAIDAVRPDLYPTVLQSAPFKLNLLRQLVFDSKAGRTLPLADFLNQQTTFSISGLIAGLLPQSDEPVAGNPGQTGTALRILPEQESLLKLLSRQIISEYDKKSGILTITVTLPDPVVAARVSQLALDYLTEYITSYRTEKAVKQATFLGKRVAEARRRYQTAEFTLESYRDRNRSLFTNVARLEEQRLQADFLLAQSVYNDLSKQLEQAKIKVQEETPVFKVLEPPQIPLRKSSPNRTFLLLLFMALGGTMGLMLALYRRFGARFGQISS